MDPATKEKLAEAQKAYQTAAQELVRVTEECYPIGQKVAVDLGRSRVLGEVTSAGGFWWSRPAEVTIKNIVTGKSRHFRGASLDIYHPEFLQT